ncbi:hypothetical protein V5O48_019179 [Marasmius crinis-equi]|uniref:Uncharacterized protein n=1 Tax=Marasmius crinis-equi TaxID=585013 RepID=A0ABR3EJ44_9AGAR
MSVHSGTTTGDVKLTWGQEDNSEWRNTIFPSFASFCMKGFSKEECRSRALPEDENEEDAPSLPVGASEKDGVPGIVTFTADDFDKSKNSATSGSRAVAKTVQESSTKRAEASPPNVQHNPLPQPTQTPSSLQPVAERPARVRPRRHSFDEPPSPEKTKTMQARARKFLSRTVRTWDSGFSSLNHRTEINGTRQKAASVPGQYICSHQLPNAHQLPPALNSSTMVNIVG